MFSFFHFALVALMIMSRKVQNAVQNKNPNFLTKGMPQRTCVASCNVEGDCNVSGKAIAKGGRGKRQYVRVVVLATETRVERTYVAAMSHHHGHGPFEPGRPARLRHEPC